MNKTLVVVFCYNVEKNINNILKKIKKYTLNNKRDFLFIDDCSTDNTNKILKSKKIKNAKIIKNKNNKGFGSNYKFSIKYSINKKYKKLIFLHGDNQYPSEKVSLIDKKLEYSDLCYGSRRLNIKSMKTNMPILRFVANIMLTNFINLLLNSNSTEYFSGFRGLRVKSLKELNLINFANSWIIEQQIHFNFINNKKKITEIPIPTVYKKTQKSKIPPFSYVFSVIINTIKFAFRG